MAFSGALMLTDLNDFISPSQACIKPVEQLDVKPKVDDPGAAKTEILIDSSGSYYEVSDNGAMTSAGTSATPARKLEQAQISLNDCLACSGCITSAESVLITLQSHTEVLNFLESNDQNLPESYKIPVISIAPQSLASLAASLSSSSSSSSAVTPRQVLRRVHAFCKEVLGFEHVFDTTFARHLALQEHIQEFEERQKKDREGGPSAEGQLPMLASACPGWICYAEKAHAEMLPFISGTKSPQQIMGTLVKEWMGASWGKSPEGVYHVSVMPCYDKKLEASRKDFYSDVYSTRDVDCVITTGELEVMMKERDWDLSHPVPHELDDLPLYPNSSGVEFPELVQHPGSSSGSYLYSIISHLMQTSPTPLTLSKKMIRNADYEELTLIEAGGGDVPGKVVFKGAKCYGFRNLQNVVRKVGRERGVRVGGGAAGRLSGRAVVGKRVRKGAGGLDNDKERQYDYVEVMACPGGCVNGGGQLKPALESARPANGMNHDEEGYQRNWEESGVTVDGIQSAKWGDKDWTRKVEEAYWRDTVWSSHDLPTPPATPPLDMAKGQVINGRVDDDPVPQSLVYANELSQRILSELGREGCLDEAKRHGAFRTQYHAVESEVVGLAVKW